ncbi:hypothetical protein Ae201684_007252 [Aphanomyces euteiches]|uniref:Uncharacterized protein n=1 Tax=Aphanomyces euteiches TaxID=100861 RepID=A0A6G0X876_9STRA|nr:hypothetical protein Ae201684_007252 [Aphanomyces euteiches]
MAACFVENVVQEIQTYEKGTNPTRGSLMERERFGAAWSGCVQYDQKLHGEKLQCKSRTNPTWSPSERQNDPCRRKANLASGGHHGNKKPAVICAPSDAKNRNHRPRSIAIRIGRAASFKPIAARAARWMREARDGRTMWSAMDWYIHRSNAVLVAPRFWQTAMARQRRRNFFWLAAHLAQSSHGTTDYFTYGCRGMMSREKFHPSRRWSPRKHFLIDVAQLPRATSGKAFTDISSTLAHVCGRLDMKPLAPSSWRRTLQTSFLYRSVSQEARQLCGICCRQQANGLQALYEYSKLPVVRRPSGQTAAAVGWRSTPRPLGFSVWGQS